MSVLDLFHPHKKAKSAEQAPDDATGENVSTVETGTTPTEQLAELGSAAVTTAQIAPLEGTNNADTAEPTAAVAPEVIVDTPADKPSDADALAAVEGAMGEANTVDTPTIAATGQNIEPAVLTSQNIENLPPTDKSVELAPAVVKESQEVINYAATAPEANIATMSDPEVREGFGLNDSSDFVVPEVPAATEQPEEEDTVIANQADPNTVAGASVDSLGNN